MNATSTRDRGELALLQAVAAMRLDDADLAEQFFVSARAYAISSGSSALEAELEFYLASRALEAGDLDTARAFSRLSIEVAERPDGLPTPAGVVCAEHVLARSQELLGVIAAADGDYRQQVVHARDALATLDVASTRDTYQEAFALRNLAILSREFDLSDIASDMRSRADALRWSPDISNVAFVTTEALGWCAALRGDVVGSLKLFRTAAKTATIDPERILVSVARALIAREAGHHAQVAEEIEHALELASRYTWADAPGDLRVALLLLAQVTAPLFPGAARRVISQYNAIRTSMDGRYAARHEARYRAEEAYTFGLVLRAEGSDAASRDRLKIAFDSWRLIGFDWRAARAAVELAELDAGELFRQAVARDLHDRPDSVFAPRARKVA